MKLGEFEIPENKFEHCLEFISTIYKLRHKESTPSKEIAILLGHKYGTEPHYYRKIKSLQIYGLIEAKGGYYITDIGENILHPKNENIKNIALKKAILHFPLWNELFEKYGKEPPKENFWAILMNVTKATPDTCKELGNRLYAKYMSDINKFTSESIEEIPKTESDEIQEENKVIIDLTKGELGLLSIEGVGNTIITDEYSVDLAIHALNVLKIKISKNKTTARDEPKKLESNILYK